MRIPVAICLFVLALSPGCGRSDPAPSPAPAGAPASPGAVSAAPIRIVFLGDSLTAGYGLPQDQAYPAVIDRRLASASPPVKIVNAGVSGDTTADGLRRIEWLLQQKPDIVVVGLGGNDALRAQSPDSAEQNLRQIVGKCRDAGAKVVLLGMKIPPNYGMEYADKFADMYPRIARDMNVALVPFMLEGVGGVASLNQGDGIHPTAEGQEKVADNIMPVLKETLAGVKR